MLTRTIGPVSTGGGRNAVTAARKRIARWARAAKRPALFVTVAGVLGVLIAVLTVRFGPLAEGALAQLSETNRAGWRGTLNLLLILTGVIGLVSVVAGGIRLITSRGDPIAIMAARNQILYAIIGLVVAMLAYTAITFVAANAL